MTHQVKEINSYIQRTTLQYRMFYFV